MKQMLIAPLCAAALLAGIPAKAADTGWVGVAVVEQFEGSCGPTRVGSKYYSVFRPADLGENGPDSYLTFMVFRLAFAVTVEGGDLSGSGRYKGMVMGSRRPTNRQNGRFRNVVVKPAEVTDATRYLSIRGRITNFVAPGCTVFFRGAYTQQP